MNSSIKFYYVISCYMTKYSCKLCAFYTHNKYNYAKHMDTIKHQLAVEVRTSKKKKTNIVTTENTPIKTKEEQKIQSDNSHENHLNPVGSIPESVNSSVILKSDDTENVKQEDQKSEQFTCGLCGLVMINNHNIRRHLTRCGGQQVKTIRQESEINRLRTELEFYKLNLEQEKARSKELKDTLEYERIKEKSHLSASNYLSINYNNAPPLLKLENFSMFEEDEVELLELLLDAESNDEFYAFVGRALVKTYKTDDPRQQQVWNSDDERLTYFIRKSFEWTIDKKGIKTGDLIIEPALSYFSNILKKFLNSDIPRGRHMTTDQILADNKRRTLATKILIDVENGLVRQKVLKYMAPHLYLDKGVKCISSNDINKLMFTEEEIYS